MKIYMIYCFEDDSIGYDEHLLVICSSEEKAKRYILNLIKDSLLKYEDKYEWIYSLSNLPTENDFNPTDNSIVISKYDEDEYHAQSGYYYSEREVI